MPPFSANAWPVRRPRSALQCPPFVFLGCASHDVSKGFHGVCVCGHVCGGGGTTPRPDCTMQHPPPPPHLGLPWVALVLLGWVAVGGGAAEPPNVGLCPWPGLVDRHSMPWKTCGWHPAAQKEMQVEPNMQTNKEEPVGHTPAGGKRHGKAQTAQKVVPLEQYRKAVEEEVRKKAAKDHVQHEQGGKAETNEGFDIQEAPTEPSIKDGKAVEMQSNAAGGVEEALESLDRVNYASASDGAKVLAANKDAKGISNVLNENKDTYMISPCASDKWLVMELSQEAAVDSIVIANFEFYSSSLKEFELLGTQEHPQFTKEGKDPIKNFEGGVEWIHLGSFEAPKNLRKPHLFTISEPAWVRYLQLRLLSHYGEETYCTLSLFRVHGTDTMESLRKEIEMASKEVEDFELALRASNQKSADDLKLKGDIAGEDKDALVVEVQESTSVETNLHDAHAPLPTPNITIQTNTSEKSPSETSNECRNDVSVNETSPSTEKHVDTKEVQQIVMESVNISEGISAEQASNNTGKEIPKPSLPTMQRSTTILRNNARQENVMNILVKKVKTLELNLTVIDKYVEDLSTKYKAAFEELGQESTQQEEQLTDLLYRVSRLELQKADEDEVLRQRIKASLQQELSHFSLEINALQRALGRARNREFAAAGISILLGALLLLNRPAFTAEGSLFHLVVTFLAISNGLISVFLQWKLLS